MCQWAMRATPPPRANRAAGGSVTLSSFAGAAHEADNAEVVAIGQFLAACVALGRARHVLDGVEYAVKKVPLTGSAREQVTRPLTRTRTRTLTQALELQRKMEATSAEAERVKLQLAEADRRVARHDDDVSDAFGAARTLAGCERK